MSTGRMLLGSLSLCFILVAACHRRPPPTATETAEPAKKTPLSYKQLESDVGLVRVNANPASFKVAFKVTERCSISDLDAILKDLAHAEPGAKLLLSIEPASTLDHSVEPVVREILKNEITVGATFSFKLPKATAAQLGVYICLDQKGEGHCNGKLSNDINAVFTGLVNDPKHYKAKDRIYFFQYLLLTREGLLFFKDPYYDAPKFTRLNRYLTLFFDPKDMSQMMRDSEAARFRMSQIRSGPLVTGKFDVEVPVPRVSRSAKCGQGQPRAGYPDPQYGKGPNLFYDLIRQKKQ